jgi:hypothetical protein
LDDTSEPSRPLSCEESSLRPECLESELLEPELPEPELLEPLELELLEPPEPEPELSPPPLARAALEARPRAMAATRAARWVLLRVNMVIS